MKLGLCLGITMINALNSGKNAKLYISNKKFPSKDLSIITPQEASFISKYWLSQCLEINNRGDEHIIKSINLIESNFQLSQCEDGKDKQILYLAWMPEGKFRYGVKDILYIIVTEIICNSSTMWGHLLAIKQSTKKSITETKRSDVKENKNNEFSENNIEIPPKNSDCYLQIKMLVQAPTWRPSQIPSENLKISLEDLSQRTFNKDLDLSVLYKNNERYKLAWKDWSCD